MKIELEIDTGSAAFEPDWGWEVSRILDNLACRFKEGWGYHSDTITLRDYNGNKCGKLRIIDTSDIPEQGPEFFKKAKLQEPKP